MHDRDWDLNPGIRGFWNGQHARASLSGGRADVTYGEGFSGLSRRHRRDCDQYEHG
jgi:hypothetical protein